MIETLISSMPIVWHPITLKRGDYLIRPGMVEKHIYFVKSGALRAILMDEEEEFTIRFGYSNSIIAGIPSYFTGEPTELYIQAIRKSVVLRASKQEFEDYLNQDVERLKVYQRLLKELVASFYEREVDLLTKNPMERLKRLFTRSPQVFQEIPQKYIASYLRMTPETLSRLMKKMNQAELMGYEAK